jgi:hypothetical protein
MPEQMHIIVVGNAKQVAPGLEKYGEVKYFDVYGNPVEAPAAKKVDASVTPQSILSKAVAAIGSPEAVAAVKDIDMAGEASLMGQTFTVTQKQIIPTSFMSAVSMGQMALMKNVMNDGKYSMSVQGQSKEARTEDQEEIKEKAASFQMPTY